MSKIHDISIGIFEGMPTYPGDPNASVTPVSRISQGDGANISMLKLGTHNGTHVDPPFHFIDSGLKVDQLALETLVGECYVCDLGDVNAIGAEALNSHEIPPDIERILFKTRNSTLWRDDDFRTDYTYLEPEGADWIVNRGLKLVGIDYLSIEKMKSETHPTHTRLLESGTVIVEGLDLSLVSQGIYTLVCLPLKIIDGDGAPARAILIED